ncbi:hypothetical protein [Aquiflexum sp.]|uniref:hypothetical protein n=1 Tax=Aquiflexum sp. TaxID=1872584 RepID=UPI003593BBFC
MKNELLSEFISLDTNAKVIVLFGGSPKRRDEVIRQLMQLEGVTIIGTLSEREGIDKLLEHKKVDLVLIGGQYTDEQRIRIRSFVRNNLPVAEITEPGYDYPYSNEAIFNYVKDKLKLIV